MSKTKKELEEIKSRVEELSVVLQELSEEELNMVLGGMGSAFIGSEHSRPEFTGIHEESCTALAGGYDESCAVITENSSPKNPAGGIFG